VDPMATLFVSLRFSGDNDDDDDDDDHHQTYLCISSLR